LVQIQPEKTFIIKALREYLDIKNYMDVLKTKFKKEHLMLRFFKNP